VPRHESTEGQIVIDIFVAIEIAEFAATGFLYKDWPGIVMAIVAGYAERDSFEILFVCFGGFGVRRSNVSSSFCNSGYIRLLQGSSSRLDLWRTSGH